MIHSLLLFQWAKIQVVWSSHKKFLLLLVKREVRQSINYPPLYTQYNSSSADNADDTDKLSCAVFYKTVFSLINLRYLRHLQMKK